MVINMNIIRIKELRNDKDLYQKNIAELGINSIPIEKLDILANFYNTSIDYLVGRTDKREPYPKSIIK